MLKVALQNSNQIRIQQLENQIDQEISLLKNMQLEFDKLNEIPNIQPIQIAQIQNPFNQVDQLNLNLIDNKKSDLIQTQQQQYLVQNIDQNQIKNQKQLIKELQQNLDELKQNQNQLKINLNNDEKHIQIYESLALQLDQNIEEINKVSGKEGYQIDVEFENASELKTYMPDYESAFKNINDLEQMMANEGLPLIGKVKTKKQKKSFWGWIVKLVVGVVQIIAGAALTYFSCGAASSIGIGLILEGCIDVFQSIKAAINNEDVDLSQYFKNKLVSLSLTCVLAGSQALIETGQLFKKGAEYAAKNGILNSTKKLLSSEVILGGLKKAGLKAIELNNIKMITGIAQIRESQSDIRQHEQEDEQQIDEEQKKNFKKRIEQMKNSEQLKNQFIFIQRQEQQYQDFLKEIREEIEKSVDQQVRQNHSGIITYLAFIIKSNPQKQTAIENILNKSYLLIDIETKDKIFENASQALVQANFNKQSALNKLNPCLQQILNELFNNVGKHIDEIQVSIFSSIIQKSLDLYSQKIKQEIQDSVKNFQQNQDKLISEINYQRSRLNQEIQSINSEQEQLLNEQQNIQQQQNILNSLRQNLNQYDSNAVNNYNIQAQQLTEQINSYNAKHQLTNLKTQQIKQQQHAFIDQTQYKENLIKQEQADHINLEFLYKQQIICLNQRMQGQQYIQRYQDLLLKMQVFKSDKVTLNSGFQNKAKLQIELTNIFDNCQFSTEIVNYIFSPQFQAEQTQINQLKNQFIQFVIQTTNDRVVMPMLQQSLNKLIKKDIQLAESKIKEFADELNKNK
ncbi:hypothetical protein ABPG74_020820 [Tetrahymena malaccensis]